jgi:hypothetical protein
MAYDPSKFTDLDRLIENCQRDKIGVLVVHHPQVLGDDYVELVTNLDKLAAAGLALKIVSPAERMGPARN